eukprot:TRINITY_DN82364_c0_g1_i1.p1 TRINITY_DN82364_c0_g1~~TRINITY_DN82364_c0_g1_i1.p1  ORF type:complete len:969 (+),score=90.35 TRINITY_DN82364_c0_g1_i1:826-3732(+)
MSCGFGQASAYLALAHATVLATPRKTTTVWRAIRRASGALALTGNTSILEPVLTQWPLWDLLHRVSQQLQRLREPRRKPADSVLEGRPLRPSETRSLSTQVAVWYCSSYGRSDVATSVQAAAKQHGWRLHLALEHDERKCPQYYDTWLQGVSFMPSGGVVVLVSPLTYAWTSTTTQTVADILRHVDRYDQLDVVGAPIVDESGTWHWTVHNLTLHGGQLRYDPLPTGYDLPAPGGFCFRSSATSGTRVIATKALQLAWMHDQGLQLRQSPANWLVRLDLVLRDLNVQQTTCLLPAYREKPYLAGAALPIDLARMYGIDSARYNSENERHKCNKAGGLNGSTFFCWQRSLQLAVDEAWHGAAHLLQGDVKLANGPRGLAMLWLFGWDAYAFEALHQPSSTGNMMTRGDRSRLGNDMDQLCFCPSREHSRSSATTPQCAVLSSWQDGSSRTSRSGRPNCGELLGLDRRPMWKVQAFGRRLVIADYVVRESPQLVGNATMVPEQRNPAAVQLQIWMCASMLPRSEQDSLQADCLANDWKLMIAAEKDFRRCPLKYQIWLSRSLGTAPSDFVLLLSPTLRRWRRENAEFISRLARRLRDRPVFRIVGFPYVSADGFWHWPARHIRRQHWRLEYSGVATRMVTNAADGCFDSDATSPTRLYSLHALRSILKDDTMSRPTRLANWMIKLDLRLHLLGISVWTCVAPALEESGYLNIAPLSAEVAERYSIEVADFTPSRRVVRCPAQYYRREVVERGLVTGWCWRKWMADALQVSAAWWTGLDEKHQVVPLYGTLLSLIRGGEHGMMPWDVDVDVLFASAAHDFTLQSYLNSHPTAVPQLQALKLEMQKTVFACRRQEWTMSLLFRRRGAVDITFGGPFTESEFHLRSTIMGTAISFSEELLFRYFYEYYDRPEQKLANGQPLRCLEPGHPACLPDCRAGGLCEFEDFFVHGHAFEFRLHQPWSPAWFDAVMLYA